MKKIENSFVVSGFVGKDASIHQFSTASVARFSLAISRTEKNGEETNLGYGNSKYLTSEVSGGFTGTMTGIFAVGNNTAEFTNFECSYN